MTGEVVILPIWRNLDKKPKSRYSRREDIPLPAKGKEMTHIAAFLRRLNSHSVANFGALLVAAGGASSLPQVAPVVLLLSGNTQHAVSVGSTILVGLGSLLLYFGRPATVPENHPSVGGPPPCASS